MNNLTNIIKYRVGVVCKYFEPLGDLKYSNDDGVDIDIRKDIREKAKQTSLDTLQGVINLIEDRMKDLKKECENTREEHTHTRYFESKRFRDELKEVIKELR